MSDPLAQAQAVQQQQASQQASSSVGADGVTVLAEGTAVVADVAIGMNELAESPVNLFEVIGEGIGNVAGGAGEVIGAIAEGTGEVVGAIFEGVGDILGGL